MKIDFFEREVIQTVNVLYEFATIGHQFFLSVWCGNNTVRSWLVQETKCIHTHGDLRPLNIMMWEQKVVIPLSQNMKICLMMWFHSPRCRQRQLLHEFRIFEIKHFKGYQDQTFFSLALSFRWYLGKILQIFHFDGKWWKWTFTYP